MLRDKNLSLLLYPMTPVCRHHRGWDALAPKSSPVGLSAVVKEQKTLRRLGAGTHFPPWLRPQSGLPAASPRPQLLGLRSGPVVSGLGSTVGRLPL